MQFLKILFWCLLAFIAAVFTLGNWTSVPIQLWGGLVAETNLPLLLLIAFLVGLVPMLIYQHYLRWRLRQRLAAVERQLADIHALTATAVSGPADAASDRAASIAESRAYTGTVSPLPAENDSATALGASS